MGETSPERPTFSSVSPSTGVANVSPGGASQLAGLPAALEVCQAPLLFNTLREAAPNTGSGIFGRKERIQEPVKPGGQM